MSTLSPLDDRFIKKIESLEEQTNTQDSNSVISRPNWIVRNPNEYTLYNSNVVETNYQESKFFEVGSFVKYKQPGLSTVSTDQVTYIERIDTETVRIEFFRDVLLTAVDSFDQFEVYTGLSPVIDGDTLELKTVSNASFSSDGTLTVNSSTVKGLLTGSLLTLYIDIDFDLSGGNYIELEGIPLISNFLPSVYKHNSSLYLNEQNGEKIRFSDGVNNTSGQTISSVSRYIVEGYNSLFVIQ